uniref:Uncharacterized protein n=1 Tax=Romanomermis culicivorax TaxID=13658 RepID=A0A915I2E6_ROMCU
CCSGFCTGTDTCSTAAAEKSDAGHFTPINDDEMDWRRQPGPVLLTEGGNSSLITDTMQAVQSMDLVKKYPHLPWVLLNQPFQVEALTAADLMLSAQQHC